MAKSKRNREQEDRTTKIGNYDFDLNKKTYVMGILNVTPDSFSDGGKWNAADAALKHCEEMIRDGASIIDVGGESTRPGFQPVPSEEEILRVVPVIERIKKEFDVPVSVDTMKAEVAKESLKAGCEIINDIWGLKKDPSMAKVIADANAFCVLMHNKDNTQYNDLIPDVISELKECCEIALTAGIAKEKIILDPGVGFGKDREQNLEVINRLGDFQTLGYPVLLGTSRKSVIGLTLDLPADQRLEGTLVTTVMAVMKGISFVRVHDVKENMRAIRMTEAILYGR